MHPVSGARHESPDARMCDETNGVVDRHVPRIARGHSYIMEHRSLWEPLGSLQAHFKVSAKNRASPKGRRGIAAKSGALSRNTLHYAEDCMTRALLTYPNLNCCYIYKWDAEECRQSYSFDKGSKQRGLEFRLLEARKLRSNLVQWRRGSLRARTPLLQNVHSRRRIAVTCTIARK